MAVKTDYISDAAASDTLMLPPVDSGEFNQVTLFATGTGIFAGSLNVRRPGGTFRQLGETIDGSGGEIFFRTHKLSGPLELQVSITPFTGAVYFDLGLQ